MAKIRIKTIGGEMLDEIAHKYYGKRTDAVQAVLDENPGLAKLGPVLPANIEIDLPDLPEPKPEVITLWD